MASEPAKSSPSVIDLWKQFLPLSVSDVTMAFGNPAISTTLAHLPNARLNLAAVGVAKAIAVFFESPIIMILHASNTLAAEVKSRTALWRFTIIAMAVLTGALVLLAVPPIFDVLGTYLFGLEPALIPRANLVLAMMLAWPAAIAWRRYFQGLLIRYGHGRAVARAGFFRLGVVATVLVTGYWFNVPGALLAGLALVSGIFAEAVVVTLAARRHRVTAQPNLTESSRLPTDVRGVWRFYWPLANSMLVIWGGRALLLGVIARAIDGTIALAVWPAAWGLVLLIGNATRMVQQVVIRNREETSSATIFKFVASVGGICSAILLSFAITPLGRTFVHIFLGKDLTLTQGVIPVLLICSALPLIIAFQNAIQGFLISEGRTSRVNISSWLSTITLLTFTALGAGIGIPGATAAASAMTLSLLVETLCLAGGLKIFRTLPNAVAA